MGKQALPGARAQLFTADPEDLIIIGLDTDDGPGHFLYDERVLLPLDDAKITGVIDNGVDEAIDVIKDGERVIVIDGRQRVRWAREANRKLGIYSKDHPARIKVWVRIRSGSDVDHMRRMVRVNEHRESDPPYVKARKAQRLLDRGQTLTQVAREFAVSTTALSNWLDLLALDTEVQKAVASGSIAASAALEMKNLPHDQQRAALLPRETPAEGESAPAPERTKSGAVRRPGRAYVKALAEGLPEKSEARAALLFALGEMDEEEVATLVRGWPKGGVA